MRTFTVALERSVQHRIHRLARLHPVDVSLVDVDFDLERIHVDDRTNTRTREAAARRKRRDDFAYLRRFGDYHAGEWRAHDSVVEIAPCQVHVPLGDLDIAALGGKLRTQRIHGGLRVIDH
jgi:hypothetical protein